MSWSLFQNKVVETRCKPVGNVPFPKREVDVWLISDASDLDEVSAYAGLLSTTEGHGFLLHCYKTLFVGLSDDSISYNFPGNTLDAASLNKTEFQKAVADALGIKMARNTWYLIRYVSEEDCFFVAAFRTRSSKSFSEQAISYINSLQRGLLTGYPEQKYGEGDYGHDTNIRFRIADPSVRFSKKKQQQDESDEEDNIEELADEVEEKIRQLVLKDFPVEVIETWLQKAVKLSRLKITADYRIFLTDYDKEIRMRQLPKTLFLWMLKHEEGSRLKDLQDHRDELLDIYRKLTNLDDEERIQASIDALVNPLANSFSEKCTAVKLAFNREISERIGKNYFIRGPQADVKRISLDRSLVDWEVEI